MKELIKKILIFTGAIFWIYAGIMGWILIFS